MLKPEIVIILFYKSLSTIVFSISYKVHILQFSVSISKLENLVYGIHK